MPRNGLLAVVFVGAACSVRNPSFFVQEDDTGGGAQTSETGAPTTVGMTGMTDVTSVTSETSMTDATGMTDVTGMMTSVSDTQTSDVTTGEPEPVCGDGQVGGVEACDDGNLVETDACLSTCEAASCGDGVVWAGMENCDDGNNIGGDDCPAMCKSLSCGDMQIDDEIGEQCDDGNMIDDDECTNICTTPFCGDGITQGDEQCDDGNAVDEDDCLASCAKAGCGDGKLHPGVEACDDGNTFPEDGCDQCMLALCGDGKINPGELCDDGNDINEDDCTTLCQPPKCGDGFVQATEKCDDGNNNANDGCTDCFPDPPKCGNGVLDPPEECDPAMPPYNGLKLPLCKGDCTIDSCFRVQNTKDPEPELMGNTWLNTCAEALGTKVVVTLLDGAHQVVYMAQGTKVGEWSPGNLTGDTKPSLEYDVKSHMRLVSLLHIMPEDGVADLLMLTSQLAEQALSYPCPTSLGDGYGVAVYSPSSAPNLPQMLVMGLLGSKSGQSRVLKGFNEATEISFAPEGMNVCDGDGVSPFLGTFLLSVL